MWLEDMNEKFKYMNNITKIMLKTPYFLIPRVH